MTKKGHLKKRESIARSTQIIIQKAKAIHDLTEFVEPRELGDALRFLQREMDSCPSDLSLRAQYRLLAAFARFRAKLFHDYLD